MLMCVGIDTEFKGLPLDKPLRDLEEWKQWRCELRAPHILVIHRKRDVSVYITEIQKVEADVKWVRGIAFVTGEVYAGLGKLDADNVNRRLSSPPAHVVSYAVPNLRDGITCAPDIIHRFEMFRRAVAILQPGSDIPWKLLEPPPWPEGLVACYLAFVGAARGVDVMDKLDSETVRGASIQFNDLLLTFPEIGVDKWDGSLPKSRSDAEALQQKCRKLFMKVAQQ